MRGCSVAVKIDLDEEVYLFMKGLDSSERRMPLSELAVKYIVHKDRAPASFKNHGYLIAPMNDLHPRQCIEKSAQLGVTTMHAWKAITLAARYGSRIALQVSFPTASDAEKFSQARFAEIVSTSPDIARMVMVTDQTKTQKQVFQARMKMLNGCVVYFQGRQGEKQVISIDTNVVFIDERDFDKDDTNIAMLQGRVGHDFVFCTEHTKGLIEEYSTPSMPGFGIDKIFSDSDQRYFHITCTRCGHEYVNELTEACVNGFYEQGEKPYKGDMYWRCPSCRRALDLSVVGGWDPARPLEVVNCRWIALKPENSQGSEGWHGYHMGKPEVAFQWISPKELIMNRDSEKYKKYPAKFKNQELGLPDIGSNQTVSLEALDKNIASNIVIWKKAANFNTVIGCDQGVWLVVGEKIYGSESASFPQGRYGVIHIEHIHEDIAFDTVLGRDEAHEGLLSQRIREFGASVVVMDDQPNTAMSRRLASKFNSGSLRHLGTQFWRLTSSKNNQDKRLLFEETEKTVTESRTKSLDELFADISNQEILFGDRGKVYQEIDTTFYKKKMWDMIDLLFDHLRKETKISGLLEGHSAEQAAQALKNVRSVGHYIAIGDKQNHLLHAMKMMRIAMEIKQLFGQSVIILPPVVPSQFVLRER